jgi:hypothetical protein
MGFRATDDDEDTPEQVVDGVVSTREATLDEEGTAFVDICRHLRQLGATEVRAGSFRAVFPVAAGAPEAAPAAAPQPVVTRVQIGAKRKEPEKLEQYEGEQLSEADKERRREFAHIADLVGRG